MAESLLLLSGRRATATPVLAPGEVRELTLDEKGQLRVVTEPEPTPEPIVFPVINKVFVTGETYAFDVSEANTVAMQLFNDGTASMNPHAVYSFEASLDSTDGVDGGWTQFYMTRSNNTVDIPSTSGLTTIPAGQASNVIYRASVSGIKMLRIKTSNVTAGAIARWYIVRSIQEAAFPPYVAVPPTSVSVSGSLTQVNRLAGLPQGVSRSIVTTASTNFASITTGARALFELTTTNPTATAAYLKLYATAGVPTSAMTPDFIVPIPPNSFQSFNFGAIGKAFQLGIGRGVTANFAPNDNTASVAGILISITDTA